MPERDGYTAGVPCWIDTTQPDPQAAADFYGGLFGWELEDVMPPGSDARYFMARIRGGDVGAISGPAQDSPPAWNTYVWVDSVDETAAKVRDAGGAVLSEPMDVMDAGRMAVLADPEGAVFSVWQANRHRGARVVNEHGSLVFNTLSTRDVAAAESFYGSVFGWKVLDLGPGGQMWRLPGYCDFLEKDNPGVREAMREAGAPDGFEDVVASIAPLPEGQSAHWSVTFAADDADALAARAAELGGRVVMPPFDAPWVRATVLADPAGATFIASQFVPENRDLGTRPDSAVSAA
jgi:predicted enzyme related to lactoylglutathione lyase